MAELLRALGSIVLGYIAILCAAAFIETYKAGPNAFRKARGRITDAQ